MRQKITQLPHGLEWVIRNYLNSWSWST